MENYVKFKCLTKPSQSNLDKTLEQAADILANTDIKADVQFRFLGNDKTIYRCLSLKKQKNQVITKPSEKPNLEIVTHSDTWWQIAEGELSPLDAFINGKLRVRGDVELGKDLMRQLSVTEGMKVDICEK